MSEHCAVCGQKIGAERILCPACDVPYHSDCWGWTGGCSIFGCAPATAVMRTGSTSPMIPVAPAPAFVRSNAILLMGGGFLVLPWWIQGLQGMLSWSVCLAMAIRIILSMDRLRADRSRGFLDEEPLWGLRLGAGMALALVMPDAWLALVLAHGALLAWLREPGATRTAP